MRGRGGWKFGEIVCPLIDKVIFFSEIFSLRLQSKWIVKYKGIGRGGKVSSALWVVRGASFALYMLVFVCGFWGGV